MTTFIHFLSPLHLLVYSCFRCSTPKNHRVSTIFLRWFGWWIYDHLLDTFGSFRCSDFLIRGGDKWWFLLGDVESMRRNPAPVDPFLTGFYTSQVVQDFFHQPTCLALLGWSMWCWWRKLFLFYCRRWKGIVMTILIEHWAVFSLDFNFYTK